MALITTAMYFVCYGGVSVLGLLAFGPGVNQNNSLVVNLSPKRGDPLALIALLVVMFSVTTCFQFHVCPIRQFSAYTVRWARGRSADDERQT